MVKPIEARADSDTINQLVRSIVNARKEEESDLSGTDPARFGLVPPQATITLKQGVEKQWQLNLGKTSTGTSQDQVVYVTSSDQSTRPQAVKHSDLETLFKSINDYRSRDLLTDSSDFSAASKTDLIKIAAAGHEPIILQKSTGERWRFDKPAYGDADYEGDSALSTEADKRITGVHQLLNDLDGVRIESAADFVADNVSDFAKYGLESAKPDRLRVEVKRKVSTGEPGKEKTEDVTRTLLIGKKTDDKGDKLYARLDGEASVARVPARSIEPVLKFTDDPALIRNRDLAQLDQAKVDAIDIQNAHGVIRLRKPGATWNIYENGQAKSADTQAVIGLLSALTARKSVQSFADAAKEADLGLTKPQATLTLWTDGLEKPAPDLSTAKKVERPAGEPKLKATKPELSLAFGRKENDRVYVRRETGSGKNVVAVAASLLGKVGEGSLAYLDRTLPSFSETASVASVSIKRSGVVYDFKNEAKDAKLPGKWSIKEPKELAGRKMNDAAIDHAVVELRGLHTDKLVAQHPSAGALEEYGLKSPASQASVQVVGADKKTEDWVYGFGKQTPDKGGNYVSLNKSDLVLVAPASVAQALAAEFADPTVLQFDVGNIKEVKMAGWKQAVGSTFKLEAERVGAKSWKVRVPADFDLDQEQIDGFVSSLANLQALKFMLLGPVRPETKLSPGDRTLQIEIVLPGGKPPLVLTVGALDPAEKAYYAQSSTVPNAVFLIPQARLEKMLATPKYFSKAAAK
jgi:hypothetical protein